MSEKLELLKVNLLLDDESRLMIKTGITALGNYGVRFLDKLDEITDSVVEYSKSVVVLEGFLKTPAALADLELYKELYGLEYTYLGSKFYFDTIGDLAECYECDLASLDFDVIQAAVYRDTSQVLPDAHNYFDYTKEATEIITNDEGYEKVVINVAKSYLALVDTHKYVGDHAAATLAEINRLKTENAKLKIDHNQLLEGYKEIIRESHRMNKVLRKYEAALTSDIYEKVSLHDYTNKPQIVYLKEYEDFLGLDEFVETLVSAFKLQDRKSTKVLRLVDSATSRKMAVVPEYYHVVYNNYLLSEITTNDFICKCGDYRKVLDKLLINEANTDVLIVIDSKSFDDVVISGTMLHMNLVREKAHTKLYDLHEQNTITNDGELDSSLTWGRYETEGMTNNDKFLYLSSRPVIKNILELNRIFMQQC